jgi:hypothetical protein
VAQGEGPEGSTAKKKKERERERRATQEAEIRRIMV